MIALFEKIAQLKIKDVSPEQAHRMDVIDARDRVNRRRKKLFRGAAGVGTAALLGSALATPGKSNSARIAGAGISALAGAALTRGLKKLDRNEEDEKLRTKYASERGAVEGVLVGKRRLKRNSLRSFGRGLARGAAVAGGVGVLGKKPFGNAGAEILGAGAGVGTALGSMVRDEIRHRKRQMALDKAWSLAPGEIAQTHMEVLNRKDPTLREKIKQIGGPKT